MEPIDVPIVTQLPELSGGLENPVAFVDMVFTSFMRCDRAFLYAGHCQTDAPNAPVSWRIHPQVTGITSREFEAGLSPSLKSFQASITYIRERYLGTAARHGCAEILLRQGNLTHRCLLFLPTAEEGGSWIRAYISPA